MTDLPLHCVTESLQRLLGTIGTLVTVSTQSPTRARIGTAGEQINLYLYQVQFDEYRSVSGPHSLRSGAGSADKLAMRMKYLITVWAAGNEEVSAHRLLGRTMHLLREHPILTREEIAAASTESDAGSRIEAVQILPTDDDVSAVWASLGFGEYRLSIVCEVSAVFQ